MRQSTRCAGVSVDLSTLAVKESSGATSRLDDPLGAIAPLAHPCAVNFVVGSGVVRMQVEDLMVKERLDFLAICFEDLGPVLDDLSFR